jgi:curli biogenesis system outer membrane secretion channel CsgG
MVVIKRSNWTAIACVAAIRLAAAGVVVGQEALARPSLAIADVAVAPGGWTLPPPQLSAAIVELMVGELVASDRFHVYDGQWLVPESEVGRADLQRLRAAAEERNVDYVVIGSLTAFSSEQKKKRLGGVLPTPFFLGGFSRDQAQLKVAMTFRIVDVRTGEIVATAAGEGTGKRRATAVLGGGIVRGLPIGAGGGTRLPQARDAMLDEAVRSAVRTAARALAESAARLETRTPRINVPRPPPSSIAR